MISVIKRKPKRGRPPLAIYEVLEFGGLVEQERKGHEKLEAVFYRVRRHDPRRWGSLPKMWRLWQHWLQWQSVGAEVEKSHALISHYGGNDAGWLVRINESRFRFK